ncbi:NAD transporter [Schizosaccharomyces japonicus yFS275]|uniref:NAD transporter n=1 Tax=Schizosaccharomyces japonicus (strain yFS275 / FY16936) TaxID=402676 RepID=B6K6J5_SCHJY|nr:NAD transporter [Schizosaccharomyces japonicus yFS275]EEB09149.1 NAD transporter [Schizosaccharomyces japonicus yFS275]
MLDTTINAVAGGVAGIASSLFVAPLDVVKTRQQAQKGNISPVSKKRGHAIRNTFVLMFKIWQREGIRGLYRGVGPLMLGYFPSWAIYFSVYEKCKRVFFSEHRSKACTSSVGKDAAQEDTQKGSPFQPYQIACAMVAGAASVSLTNPIWVVKTRLITQEHPDLQTLRRVAAEAATKIQFRNLQMDTPSAKWRMPRFWAWRRQNLTEFKKPLLAPTGPACAPRYNSTFDAFYKIYKYEGMAAFYRGLMPSLFGTLHVGLQFPLYEYFKDKFLVLAGEDHQYLGIISAASLSKIAASAVTYPHEVLRTRLQSLDAPTHNSMALLIRDIWRSEGWKKYYAGMGTNFIRTIPASSVTLLTFEVVRKLAYRISS